METKAAEAGGAGGGAAGAGGSYLKTTLGAALAAGGVAALVNGSLYLVGELLGAFPDTAIVAQRGGPLTLAPILALSLIPPLVGMGIYVLLSRFTRRAFGVFLAIAAVVLVFMARPPFQIEAVPTAQIAILQVMHLVTAGATILAVSRVRRRRSA